MALFGSSEKKPEVKTEFMFDTESTINQSTLAKDIKINGSLESTDYIDFSGHLTGTIKSQTLNLNQVLMLKELLPQILLQLRVKLTGYVQD